MPRPNSTLPILLPLGKGVGAKTVLEKIGGEHFGDTITLLLELLSFFNRSCRGDLLDSSGVCEI